MEYPITLIYLFDEETLGELHRGWPHGVQAALCLEEEGGGNVALLTKEEAQDAATHISSILGRDDSDFVFVPKFGGYPTRRVSFGEEQQLCGMIAEMEDLPGRARAYLARSDEQEATGPVASGVHVDQVGDTETAYSARAVHDVPQKKAGAGGQNRSPAREPSRLPSGFLRPDSDEISQPLRMKGHLSIVGDRARLTVSGARFLDRLSRPCVASEAGVSRDRTQICIVPSDCTRWQPKPGASILFPLEALKAVMQDVRCEGAMLASVTVVNGRLLVSLDNAAPTPTPAPAPAVRRPRAPRRALAGPAFAAVVAFAMFQVGTSEEALEHMREAAQSVSYQE